MRWLVYPFLILMAVSAFAQPPTVLWNHSYGDGTSEEVHSVRPVPGGGFILAGVTDEGSGYTAAWLLRADENGEELWSSVNGGDLANAVYYAEPTEDGFIQCGSTWSYSGNDSWDAYIGLLNADGQPQWQRLFGSATRNDWFNCARVVPDGGFIACGYLANQPSLWRIGPQGSVYWVRNQREGEQNDFTFVEPVTDGFLAAMVDSSRFAVLRIESNGDFRWRYLDDEVGAAECVRAREDGSIFACGYREPVGGMNRAWLVMRLSADGVPVWTDIIDDPAAQTAEDLWFTADDKLIVSGWSQQLDGSVDRWLIKYDLDGNRLWQFTLPGGRANSVAQAWDGGYVFAGTHGSTPHESVDFRLFKTTPEVTVDVAPLWNTVPPQGQVLLFSAELSNILTEPTPADVWVRVTTPGGLSVPVGDLAVTLQPGATFARPSAPLFVPAPAPGGVYTVNVYIGDRDEDRHLGVGSFRFYKNGQGMFEMIPGGNSGR